ncbi:MAG: efflux RND transporter periplasmic adaptor subunit [Polyangia bacterium]
MSQNDPIRPVHEVEAAPPPSSPVGRIVIALLVLGLMGWTIVRVVEAKKEQARLAVERNAAAEQAKKEQIVKPAVLVSGELTTWTPVVRIEGTLQPVEEADIGFKVTGRLSSIRAKVGDHVRRGQTLATLDATEAAASLAQAQAQVRASEAQLKLAEDTQQRTAALTKSGAGSAQAGQQAESQHTLASAQADSARAMVALAQATVGNSVLVAPFAGFVTKVPSGTGAVVSPNMTLFHVQNTTELKLAGTVGEADVGLVSPGLAIQLAGTDGKPESKVEGKVTAVLGSVDSQTRRVPIEARVPNDPKHPLLAGTYVRSEVVGRAPVQVLKLPTGVLRPGSQDEVMVADGGRMHVRRIVFSPGDGGIIYVRSGLDAREKVVLDPSPEAKDGELLLVVK